MVLGFLPTIACGYQFFHEGIEKTIGNNLLDIQFLNKLS